MLFLWCFTAMGQIVFTDGFETGNTVLGIPSGWTAEASGWVANNNTTTSYSRQPHTGTWYCQIPYNQTKWMFKQVSLETGKTYSFAMWAKQDVTTGASIAVKYGTSATSASMTNTVVASTAVSNTWLYITGDFTVATTGTYYIGILGTVNNTPWYVCIDDISLEALGANPPNCANIASPANSGTNVLPTATLNWTSGGGAPTGYKLYFGTDNPPTNIVNGTNLGLVTTYDPTPDLSYSTNYYWKVVPYNAYGDATGCSIWSFTTAADPTIVTLPYSEKFDAVTAPAFPNGWTTKVSSSTASAVVTTTTSSTPYSSPNHAYLYNYSDNAATLILTSPPVSANLNTLKLKFYAKNGGSGNLLVGTMDSPTGTFTQIQSITLTSTYTQYTVDLSSYVGSNHYIAFKHANGGTYRTIYIDDFYLEALPVTPIFSVNPTSKDFGSLIANNVSTSQTFTVTNTGVGTLTFAAGSITLTGANADQFTLTDNNTYPINLTANQTCTVSVKFSPTSAGAKSASLQFIHNTTGSPSSVALTGNALAVGSLFESFEGTWLPTAWSADASSWNQSTAAAYDGTKSASLYTISAITDKKLMTPKVSVTGSSQLTYYAKASSSNQYLQIKYSTDKTSWTNIGSQITLTSTFTPYTVDLSSLSGQNVYLAFSASTNTTYSYFYVDYVMGPVITQEAPVAATIGVPANSATGISPTSSLTWSANPAGGIPTGYKIYLGTDNPPTNIVNGTDLGLVTTYDPNPDMSYSTTYYWQIVPYNTIGNASSCPVWSFSTMADPSITSFPFVESFDGATFPPTNWATQKTFGSGNPGTWERYTAGTYPTCTPHSGAAMSRYNSYNLSSGTKGTLTTPPLKFVDDAYRVKFWMYRDNGSANADLVNVYYNTTNTLIGATLLGTINRSRTLAPVVATDGWYEYTYNMPTGATGTGRYIIFEGVSAYGNNMFIDDVTVEAIPAVPTLTINPTSKNYGNVMCGNTSAQTFTISNGGGGTLTITNGGITITGTNADQFTLTDNNTYPINLTTGQSATVSVAFAPTTAGAKSANLQIAHNAAGSPSSADLSGTAYECNAQSIPYSENFDGVTAPAIPLCMTVTNNNSDAKQWETTTAQKHSGTNSIMIGYGAITMNDWFFSHPLNLVAGHTYTVRFYYASHSGSYPEKLEVKWGTNATANDMTGGQIFNNANITNAIPSWVLGEGTIVPVATGTYYIGWHGYSAANMFNIYVDDISVSETPASTTWTGTTNNDWATTTNWSNGLPGNITDVTIPAGLTNYPTVASASTIKSLVMGDGATLLGFKLLTITDGATLTRNISGKDDYHLISSPVQTITAGQAFPSNQNHIWVRSYDEPTGNWNNLEATSALTPGIGYSFFMDIPSTSAVFNGQFNVGNGTYISPALTLSGSVAGYGRYNLLGNPYPATLDWDLGTWTKTGLEASVWVWSDPIGAYVSWNGSAGSLSNGVIPVAQGFFVKGTDLAFSASIRIPIDATRHNQQGFYKEAPQKVLRLDVTNSVNPYQNSLFVQYTENATAGFDDQFDTRKMSDLDETPELWAMAGETRVSIDALPSIEQNSEVDVWFKPGVDAQYTLTASGMETFANGDVAYLIDNLTGYKQNINQNPVYTFSAQAAPASSRFKITFSGVGIENPTTTSMGAYSLNGRIIVQLTDAATGVLNITNMAGQKMTSQSFSNVNEITTNGTYRPGIYLVSVTTATGTITRKVVVL